LTGVELAEFGLGPVFREPDYEIDLATEKLTAEGTLHTKGNLTNKVLTSEYLIH